MGEHVAVGVRVGNVKSLYEAPGYAGLQEVETEYCLAAPHQHRAAKAVEPNPQPFTVLAFNVGLLVTRECKFYQLKIGE